MSDETTRRPPGEGELRARLADEQFRITRHKETERVPTKREDDAK